MINLWYEDSHLGANMSGPKKVIENLKKSLLKENIDYAINEDKYSLNFLLHYDDIAYKKHENLEHSSCFIGPQFWPFGHLADFLRDNPSYYNQLIVPSQWVKNLHCSKLGFKEDKVSIWPVGIEIPDLNKNIEFDCLVYFKNRNPQELQQALDFLSSKNLTYKVIKYGEYKEQDFYCLLNSCRFSILIDSTESQGIAMQEVMAYNVPLLVWDVKTWNHMGQEYEIEATSVPYWSSSCGEKFFDFQELDLTFEKFYGNLDSYTPRQFVEENISFSRSVKTLLEIMNAC